MAKGKLSQSRRGLWTDSATRDLEDIIGYVAADAPDRARRLLGALERRAASLRTTPRRGRLVPELAELGMRDWREIVVRPYRIIYRITDDTVIVLAVLDARRDLRELLLERLVRAPLE